jgi:twitching motility protein PilT
MSINYKKFLDDLVSIVVKENASDLHIAEGRSPIIRVSGLLIPLSKIPALTGEDMYGLMDHVMTPEYKQRFVAQKEIDFSYSHEETRFRGNGFFQQGKSAIALRLIPHKIKTLEELQLPPILESFTRKTQGFFLVVGPVGQGKSTTLSSMIEIINNERLEHILTIEDPIEYMYEPKKSIIDQREVRLDTADFPTALVSMFRQDINVVLIGEMRGPDTIATAVTAAETGHLVFSTLHTNNAAQTIDRVIDSFPADQQSKFEFSLPAV